MIRLIVCLVLISIIYYSCGGCVQRRNGIVINKKTGNPIDSVYFHKIGEHQGNYSDSSGRFEIHGISGGVFGCPVLKLDFVKDGYDLISDEASPSDTIYMIPTHYSK